MRGEAKSLSFGAGAVRWVALALAALTAASCTYGLPRYNTDDLAENEIERSFQHINRVFDIERDIQSNVEEKSENLDHPGQLADYLEEIGAECRLLDALYKCRHVTILDIEHERIFFGWFKTGQSYHTTYVQFSADPDADRAISVTVTLGPGWAPPDQS